jgi:hypothetical protein
MFSFGAGSILPRFARLGKDFVPLFSRWRRGWFGTGQTLKGFLEERCLSFGYGLGVRSFHKSILVWQFCLGRVSCKVQPYGERIQYLPGMLAKPGAMAKRLASADDPALMSLLLFQFLV